MGNVIDGFVGTAAAIVNERRGDLFIRTNGLKDVEKNILLAQFNAFSSEQRGEAIAALGKQAREATPGGKAAVMYGEIIAYLATNQKDTVEK